MQKRVRTVHHCAETVEIHRFSAWLVVDAPAMLGSSVNTCTATVTRSLQEEFHDFPREGVDSDPEVDFVLLSSFGVEQWHS